MEKVILKNTDLSVSQLSLGTVHYGTAIDAETAESQMNQFTARGGNFIDTAHVYGDWVPGEKSRSEHVIGRWLKKTGQRHQIIISTKGAHPDLSGTGVSRVTPKEILKDLEESLLCLNTDYIDLYFLHRDNQKVPVEELLGILEDARSKGKIRYYGCSNWALSRLRQANTKAFPGFVCNQLMFSLADINAFNINDKTLVPMDQDTYAYHKETGLNAMAYTSLSKGFFAKRVSGKPIPDSISTIYSNPSNDLIFKEIKAQARSLDCSLPELELAFLMHQEFTVVPIVSFSNPEQLDQGLKSSDLQLDEGMVQRLQNLKRYVYNYANH